MENKIMVDGQTVTFRADGEEVMILDRAANASGRGRSDVIRRLLRLADTPAGRAILGIVEPVVAGGDWVKEAE